MRVEQKGFRSPAVSFLLPSVTIAGMSSSAIAVAIEVYRAFPTGDNCRWFHGEAGMVVRKLTKEALQADPYAVWNSYVDLIAREDYRDLNAIQRPAHLVFWYESEVQNGGHFQYFENQGTERLNETIESLGVLGAIRHQQVLREAGELYLGRPRPQIATVEEFCKTALEDEFSVFDHRFHEASPLLQQCLEDYLRNHQSSFVVIV